MRDSPILRLLQALRIKSKIKVGASLVSSETSLPSLWVAATSSPRPPLECLLPVS